MNTQNCDKSKFVSGASLKFLPLVISFLCIVFFPLNETYPQTKPSPFIHSVEITGNKVVEESTIRYYLKTKKGDRFSMSAIREDIKKLYSLGFFDDITADVEEFEGKLKVAFILKEKPSIQKITVQGTKKLSQEDIYKVLTIKTNTIINTKQILASIEKIKSLYEEKGYYFARINYTVKELEERRVAVNFKINEGEKYKIKDIKFQGNAHLSERQIKKVMETKEVSLWRTITSLGKSGKLVKSKLETDTRRIAGLYAKNGFIETEVKDPSIKLNREKDGILISISIHEGHQYKVGKVNILTDDEFPIDELKEAFGIREGDIFDGLAVPDSVRKLTEYYTKRGYAFANVDPVEENRPEENLADISLTIEKGAKVKFGQLDITGNERTRDKVIRREAAIKEGELYDSSLINKTRTRLQHLNYFSETKIASKKRPDENLVDMEIQIKEKQTGTFSGGGGFSSQQGIFAVLRISQRNLFGRGWFLSGEGTLGAERNDLTLRFTEPHFLDTKLSTSIEYVNRFEDFDTFNIDTLSGALVLGYPLRENLSVALGYTYENNDITGVKLTDEARRALRVQEGTFVTSALLPSIAYSTLNNPLNPSKGLRWNLKNKISTRFMGSDVDYYRTIAETRYYHPVPKSILPLKKAPTLMLRNVLGYATGFGGDELPIFERFFLGGGSTLRGFNFRDVGPKDEFGFPLGGSSSLLFSTELSFPLASMLQVVFFFDAGNVFLKGNAFNISDLRYSVGPGFRANTPFGPVSVFVGYKLDRRAGEKSSEIHFDFGRSF